MAARYQWTSTSTIKRSSTASWLRTRCRKTTMIFSCATIGMISMEWQEMDMVSTNNPGRWDLGWSSSRAPLASRWEGSEWLSNLQTSHSFRECLCRINSHRWLVNQVWITTLRANSFSNRKFKMHLTTIWIKCKNLDNSSNRQSKRCLQWSLRQENFINLIISCLRRATSMIKTQSRRQGTGQVCLHHKECQSVVSEWEVATQRRGKVSEIKNTAKSVISQFKDLTLKIVWG